MWRHVVTYGLVGGGLILLLEWTHYRFLVVEHSVEVYGGLVAACFGALGIWLGLHFTQKQPAAPPQSVVKGAETAPPEIATADGKPRPDLGLTRREMEILQLIAQGLSNREIADRLFVSENTAKTHCSRVLEKLGARRRTQAVQLGKE